MSIQERLQIVLKMHNLTPSAFADKIGVQRSNVSHVLSGRNKPGLDFLEKIILQFPRVNAHWLITGLVQDQIKNEPTNSALNEKKVEVEQLVNPKGNDDIEQIIIFYTDKSFRVYKPNAQDLINKQ